MKASKLENYLENNPTLNEVYQSLTTNQRKFADWLITEKDYNPYYAIPIAANSTKWSYIEGKARSEKVTRMWKWYKYYLNRFGDKKTIDVKDIIRFKNFLKQYYELDYDDRMKVFGLMYYNWSPEKAIEKYEEAFWLIDRFYNERYLEDHELDPVLDHECFERLGKAMYENGILNLDDCPEYYHQYINLGLMAEDEKDNIFEIKNPDTWENDVSIQLEITYYFYKDENVCYEDYGD